MHSPRDFHILFVPRRSMLCEQRLKEQGVLGSFINIDEYILDLIPYDGDLLSMEYESAFRVCSACTHQIYSLLCALNNITATLYVCVCFTANCVVTALWLCWTVWLDTIFDIP